MVLNPITGDDVALVSSGVVTVLLEMFLVTVFTVAVTVVPTVLSAHIFALPLLPLAIPLHPRVDPFPNVGSSRIPKSM